MVEIADPAGLLATNGFLDGDVIVAMQDRAYKDVSDMFAEVANAIHRRERMRVTVLRGGYLNHVLVDPGSLLNRKRWGGKIEPAALPGR